MHTEAEATNHPNPFYTLAKIASASFGGIAAACLVIAAQLWEFPYARTAMLEASYFALQIFLISSVISGIELFVIYTIRSSTVATTTQWIAVFLIGVFSLYGLSGIYGAMRPLQACMDETEAICVSKNLEDFKEKAVEQAAETNG